MGNGKRACLALTSGALSSRVRQVATADLFRAPGCAVQPTTDSQVNFHSTAGFFDPAEHHVKASNGF